MKSSRIESLLSERQGNVWLTGACVLVVGRAARRTSSGPFPGIAVTVNPTATKQVTILPSAAMKQTAGQIDCVFDEF